VDKVNDDMIKKDDSERRAVAMVADEFQAGTRKDILSLFGEMFTISLLE
jgi:hypothetical protein